MNLTFKQPSSFHKYTSFFSNTLITNTLLLAATGVLCRIIGFFFRIYMSRTFGAENIGIYQLISPIMALAYSLTVSGFQTAISKLVASEQILHRDSGCFIFSVGCLCVLGLSSLISYFVYTHAPFLATHFLLETRTTALLKVLSLSFPLSGIHGCINGYFYGKKNTAFPSITQLIEQSFRVFSVYILCSYFYQGTDFPPISYAVTGIVLGEAIACIVSLCYLGLHEAKEIPNLSDTRTSHSALVFQLFLLALPLSASRTTQNILQSLEAIALPERLRLYGLDNATALSHYGILTGMVLPLILFPTAITNSLSLTLMPEIAQAQALHQKKKIQSAFHKSITLCFLVGFSFTGLLFLFSVPISTFIFKEPLCTNYIRTICFMCPFLYCNATLSSIMHGLGKTVFSFLINVTTLILRLFLTYLYVPVLGMQGYLLILLISQILLFLLQLWVLNKTLFTEKSISRY